MSYLLLDSDVLVGLFYTKDLHYSVMTTSFEKVDQLNLIPAISNFVIAEVATVLSHKSGQELANSFLDSIEGFEVIYLTKNLYQDSLAIFKQQTKKGTSFVDCTNVALMQTGMFQYLWSFDKFYSRHNIPLLKL